MVLRTNCIGPSRQRTPLRMTSGVEDRPLGASFKRSPRKIQDAPSKMLTLCFEQNPSKHSYFVAMNVFTTIAFGCMPTGISVNSEYSLGSSLRGLRFWITLTSPDSVPTTSR